MKISYKIANLRKIKSTPYIQIRPLTILVGRNSAGKSTFLRSLPLLRQSVETKASAPVLWWGDYVDFGNFKSAVYKRDTDLAVSFSFRVEDFGGGVHTVEASPIGLKRRQYSYRKIDYVDLTHEISGDDKVTRKDRLIIKSSSTDSVLEMVVAKSSVVDVYLDGEAITDILPSLKFFSFEKGIFDEFTVAKSEKQTLYATKLFDECFNKINQILRSNTPKNLSFSTIYFESRRVLGCYNFSIDDIKALNETCKVSFKKFYRSLLVPEGEKVRYEISRLCKVVHYSEVVRDLNSALKNYFSVVEYIGPARARSERFYRQQELEVSNIAPDGQNLPMFLASLSDENLKQFSGWVEDKFGYGVRLDRSGYHISINLVQGEEAVNVVDTGYGVSQVLPILAQIWWMALISKRPARNRAPVRSGGLLAIEQPELHLHPAHQALLAEVFADVASSPPGNSGGFSLVIETHSEALVNKIGDLIYQGKIDASAVQIVVFGEREGEGDVSLSHFDQDGVLVNWPYGFFVP